MTEPIEITVKRYVCPFCRVSRSKRAYTAAHIGRCWTNPAVKACRTCVNFTPNDCCGLPDLYGCYTPMCGVRSCAAGIDIDESAPMVTDCEKWTAKR